MLHHHALDPSHVYVVGDTPNDVAAARAAGAVAVAVASGSHSVEELESIGVDQFNIYLMTHGQEEVLQAYGDEILPRFSQVTA